MKRFASSLLALMLLLSLAACGEGGLSLRPEGAKRDGKVITPEDGVALGYEGDTLRTKYFEMTIENPRTSAEYDGLTAEAGYQFLAADLTLYNHTNVTQPMFDTDFEVVWDLDDDDAWAWPECNEEDDGGKIVYSVKSDTQIPVEFELGIHKTTTGVLLFQVPEDCKDFYIAYYEIGEPEHEGGEPEYGDSFFVRFSA